MLSRSWSVTEVRDWVAAAPRAPILPRPSSPFLSPGRLGS